MTQSSTRPNAEDYHKMIQDEAKVYLRSHRDLNPEYEDELVDSFVQKIEKAMDARIDAKLAQARSSSRHPSDRQIPLGLLAICMAFGIPLTAIAGGIGGLAGIITVWSALVFLILYFDLRR